MGTLEFVLGLETLIGFRLGTMDHIWSTIYLCIFCELMSFECFNYTL